MSNVKNIEDARKEREMKKILDAIIDDLGVDAERLGIMIAAAPDDIREAVSEAMERYEIYNELKQIKAQEDEAEGIPADACYNGVCPKHNQSHCDDGPMCAQGCIFRMVQTPPSDPFQKLPSHAEAIRMLQRLGELKPDDFGAWNGTDFIFHENVKDLWKAYIDLLVETGKINNSIFTRSDGTEVEDFGEKQKQAKRALKVLKR